MPAPATGLPRLSYTSRDYASILTDLMAYVQQTRPDLQTDFFESSLGMLLLELTALVGDLVSFGLDSAALECFLSTARRRDSILRFGKSVGYKSRSASPATAHIFSTQMPARLVQLGGVIPAGSLLTSPAGVTYELLSAKNVTPNSAEVDMMLTEGQTWTEQFDSTNRPRFSVTTARSVVAQSSWHVFIGDPANPANEWTEVDNVALEVAPTTTYEADFEGDGRLTIQFGDGAAGKIPDSTITVIYRTSAGAAGNATVNVVTGTMTVNLTGGAGTVTLSVANIFEIATGGVDAESADEMRVNIPAFIRSGDKLTTIRDYDSGPRRVPGVAQSFADLRVASYRGNVVDVSVWAKNTVNFTSESINPPLRSTTTYDRFALASASLQSDVTRYLRDHTDVAVLPVVIRAPIAWVDLYVNQLAYDGRYPAATVHQGVTQAVVDVFQKGEGFTVRLSDLYDAIRGVAGVMSFILDRAVFEYQGYGRAQGVVSFTPLGGGPRDGDIVSIDDGTQVMFFEFDANNATGGVAAPVPIGVSQQDTMANFVNAVNNSGLTVFAANNGSAVPSCTLVQSLGGSAFNRGVTSSAPVRVVTTGMNGGSDTVATFIEDRRQNLNTNVLGADPWPPGPYVPGEPFVSYSTAAWQDGGIKPYYPIGDFIVNVKRYAQDYYDQATVYNNEIVYNNPKGQSVVVQAINLRRLRMELVPQVR